MLPLLLSCRDLSVIPSNPLGPATGDTVSSTSLPGLIVVRFLSFSEDTVHLAWTDTDTTRSSYFVERQDADGAPWILLAERGSTTRDYTDGGVKQILHPYMYRISAVKGWSERVYSKPAQLYLNPRRPLSVRPLHLSPQSVMLQWNFTGNISTGFLVQRSLDGTDYMDLGITPRDQLTFTDTGLDTTKAYYYRAFTLTHYAMGPSSAPIRVAYTLNPMYGTYQWMAVDRVDGPTPPGYDRPS